MAFSEIAIGEHGFWRTALMWIVDGILKERRNVSGDMDKGRWIRGDTGV